MSQLKANIKELRKLLQDEQAERDNFKAHCILQRKKINATKVNHEKEAKYLERGLTQMNEVICNNTDLSMKVMKQLERNSKNMIAKQASQFFNSKYQKSKMLGSIYTNKSRFELNMSTIGRTINENRDSLSNNQYVSNVQSALPKQSSKLIKSDLLQKDEEEDENMFARHSEVKESDEEDRDDDMERDENGNVE